MYYKSTKNACLWNLSKTNREANLCVCANTANWLGNPQLKTTNNKIVPSSQQLTTVYFDNIFESNFGSNSKPLTHKIVFH